MSNVWLAGRIETVGEKRVAILYEVPGKPTQRLIVPRSVIMAEAVIEGQSVELRFINLREIEVRSVKSVRLSWWQVLLAKRRARRVIRLGRSRNR